NWTNVSDRRFKTNVQENVVGIDFIMKLRPVTYNLDMDAIAEFNSTPDSMRLFESEKLKASEIQSGFIAQEVEKAALEVGYDFHGVDAPKNETSHYGLRYAEFVVPLVQATQEQQIIIENLNSKIDVQENEILQLTYDLEQQKRDIEALRIMIVELQSQLSTE
ncbi:MAG: tail fiber domain-containing protein, partial [Bacteroidales bacterium]|nr:tail fiber domain-containing protein [Bacteroidales bacterium]